MELFLLYLFLKLDTLQGFFFVLAGFCGFAVCCCIIASDKYEEFIKHGGKRFITLLLIILAIGLTIPTTKQMAVLLAGWGILEIAKSETAGRLASKSVQVIEQALDGFLQEPVKKEKK